MISPEKSTHIRPENFQKIRIHNLKFKVFIKIWEGSQGAKAPSVFLLYFKLCFKRVVLLIPCTESRAGKSRRISRTNSELFRAISERFRAISCEFKAKSSLLSSGSQCSKFKCKLIHSSSWKVENRKVEIIEIQLYFNPTKGQKGSKRGYSQSN
jgi:hypothetical protein